MKVSIIGSGNVGLAIAADLSIKGHEVTLIKTSDVKSEAFERLRENDNRIYLKEGGKYTETKISNVAHDFLRIQESEVIIVTIQSTYHEEVYKRMAQHLYCEQIVVSICSYMSSFYLLKYCDSIPMIAETTGPYLEGRIELEDKPNEVVFRVGCRLTRSPLSVFQGYRSKECMWKLNELYKGFSDDYSIISLPY